MVPEPLPRLFAAIDVHSVGEVGAVGVAAADAGAQSPRRHRAAECVEGGAEALGDGLGAAGCLGRMDQQHEEAVRVRQGQRCRSEGGELHWQRVDGARLGVLLEELPHLTVVEFGTFR